MNKKAVATTWGFLILGVVMAFHPTLFSSFTQVQTDLGDTRFNNLILEHAYLWLIQAPWHTVFWNPPIFYPTPNTLAYSDTLLTAVPFYAPWRAMGASIATAFQLWMISCAVLNYFAFDFFLKKAFRFSAFASAVGAFLFAFGSSRITQTGHPQLIPQFYSAIALFALWRIVSQEKPKQLGFALFTASAVLQLWCCFYLGWFLIFGLAVAAICAASYRSDRQACFTFFRTHRNSIIAWGLIGTIALLPMLWHYLQASRELGLRRFGDAWEMVPRPVSWFFKGDSSWFQELPAWAFSGLPARYEHAMGVGIITSLIAALELYSLRKNPRYRLLALTAFWILIAATNIAGRFSIWNGIFHTVPGARAIRAVSRIGIMFLIPVAIGIAHWMDRMKTNRKYAYVMVGLLAIVLEQGHTTPSFAKAEAEQRARDIASVIPKNCDVFFGTVVRNESYSWAAQIDAMWAAFDNGKATINGYSGNQPPTWHLEENVIRNPGDKDAYFKGFSDWVKMTGIENRSPCFVFAEPTARR